MYDYIIIHYSEIAIKGGNRPFFEECLVHNVRAALPGANVMQKHGQIIIGLSEKSDVEIMLSRLSKISGIANYSPAVRASVSIDDISKKAISLIANKEFSTFRVSAKRSNKQFSLDSDSINKHVGEKILDHFPQKKVKLKGADLELFISVGQKEAFVYTQKFSGIRGLPVGSSGRVVSSLSGGIDSPVASYMAMTRGCKVILVHIHNPSYGGSAVKEKILKLSKILSEYQFGAKTEVFIVPFDSIQKAIIMSVPSKVRMIVYRRFMMRIINKIALVVGAKAVITGDSIGQVASQTLDNINCIQDSSVLPVLSPLIGLDKTEIINVARRIGTFDTSMISADDCCSFMIAKNPETAADLEMIKSVESKIDNSDVLVDNAVKNAEVIKF
jgi:tRNA uracil 4-sulfurtransferase